MTEHLKARILNWLEYKAEPCSVKEISDYLGEDVPMEQICLALVQLENDCKIDSDGDEPDGEDYFWWIGSLDGDISEWGE